MITEAGRVVVVEADCLWVETIQRSTCSSCAAEKGCGQGIAARFGAHSSYLRVLLEGRDANQYRVDDEVTIGIPDDVVANSSLIVYLTPLVGLIAGVLLGDGLFEVEAGVVVTALLGFAGGAALVRVYSHLRRHDRRFQPFLVDGLTPLNWQT